MKRTFTFLFAALFAFMGVWAQLPVTSTAPADGQWNADTKWYTLQVKGAYVSLHNADGNANLMLNNSTISKNAQSLWCVVGSEADGYQFYNLASGTSKVLGATGSDGAGRMTMYDAAGGVDGVTYRFDIKAKDGNAFVKKQGDNNEWWNSRDNYLSYWNSSAGYGDDGSKCIFAEVNLADFVADYKTSAKSALDALGSLFEVADAKAAVDAVTATGVDAFAAVDAAIAAKLPQYLTFRNSDAKEGSVRLNNYLSAYMPDGKGHGTPNFSAQNATWTLKYSGGFCLYNEANGVYLGAPSANGALSKAPIALYTFEVIEDNKVELKANGQTLHLNNHQGNGPVVTSGYFLSNYDSDDPASRWYVETYDYKAELAALIAANEDKHADVPTLGQYATSAYQALVEANKTATTIVEVAEAIAAFNASLNVPVYFITSAWDNGYPAGSAILYNGSAWKWAAANKFDKQMWMTIPGYTKADVPVVDAYDANGTSYAICDYLTGTKMRGKDVQIVKIAGWEGAYSLQYNADANSKDAAHHAQSGGALVNWKPAVVNDCQASAWRVEYMGASYDLGKLTDGHSAALVKLQTTYDANEDLKDVTIGTALGQYSGSKDDLVAALDAAKEILAKNIVEVAKMEVSAIEAAEAAVVAGAAKITFNVPVDGKYYRIIAVSGWNDDARYLGSKNSTAMDGRAEFVAEADTNTIFLFQGGYLKNYATDLYLVSNSNFLGYNGEQAAGSKIAFYAASNGLAGAYNISFNEDARWLYCHTDNYTDAGSRGTQNGYCFNIGEVQETELPALKALCDEFTTQTEMFKYLGEDEAMEALQMLKERWTGVKEQNDKILAKIANDELVLKGDVEYAIEYMEAATEQIESVLAYYTETYLPTLTFAEAILAKYEEESDEYKSLAAVIEASKKLTNVSNVSSLESMVAGLKANEVYALYDIDAPIETGETGWVDITRVEVGYPAIENPAFETLDYWGISQTVIGAGEDGENLVLRGEEAYSNLDTEWSVLEILPKGEKAVVNIQQDGFFEEGMTYRLSAKVYHKGATNAVFFVGDNEVEIPEEEWITFENAADKFWNNYTVKFEFKAPGDMTIGYSCEFENADAALYVSDLKLEKVAAETTTLREMFENAYSSYDMTTWTQTGFANIQNKEYYPAFEALHPEYEALLAEIDSLYDVMWENPVLKTEVAEAVDTMNAMSAKMNPVIDYAMGDTYQGALWGGASILAQLVETSQAYVALDVALDGAMDLSQVTTVAELEAKLAAINEALKLVPIHIELNMEEAELNLESLTVQLVATVGAETAEQTVYWESSDEEVATVDENGLVTAVGQGEATITAYTVNNGITAECVVYVDDLTIYPTGVTLNLTVDTLTTAGATVQLEATVAPEDAEDKTITWTTSDEKVATVDADGKVTAVANGTAVITATSANGKTATCTIVVAIPEDEDNGIESIEVEGNAVIYDIHGRRVEKMEKGFYIVNGRKVLVK